MRYAIQPSLSVSLLTRCLPQSNVYALYSCASGLASGASDGKVRLWSLTLEPKGVYDMLTFGAFNPTVRALIWDPPAQKLLVGTMVGFPFFGAALRGPSF